MGKLGGIDLEKDLVECRPVTADDVILETLVIPVRLGAPAPPPSGQPTRLTKAFRLAWKLALAASAIALLAWGAVHWMSPRGSGEDEITATVIRSDLVIKR